jgi:hypothetical protein
MDMEVNIAENFIIADLNGKILDPQAARIAAACAV